MAAVPTLPTSLANIIPAYLYVQYQDDDNLQALVAAFNSLAQGYLDWFNETPLGVYTSPAIGGPLLDWVATGIYGIERPVLGIITSYSIGALNSWAVNTLPVNGVEVFTSGSAAPASDDIYKRTLTWWLYTGDGRQMSIDWIKRRVARFLYGVNGTDVSYPTCGIPSVQFSTAGVVTGAINTFPLNALPVDGSGTAAISGGITITVPPSSVATALQTLVQNGALALPFENSFTVKFS